MRRRLSGNRRAPRWWPEGEPWPPRSRDAQRRARRFAMRSGFAFGPFVFMAVFGAMWLVQMVGRSAGIGVEVPPELLPVATAAPLLLVIAFVVLGVRRIGRPLGEVVQAADRVAVGDFSVRVPERGSAWIRTLGRAFNSMAGRLQQQEQQRRELMADVAHELRTPLAVMQGRLEGMLDGVYPLDAAQATQILDQTRHLARLVEDLRTLAHSQGGTLRLEREPTDLALLLEDAATSFEPAAHERGVTINVEAPADLPALDVDPVRIREVVANLIANALRYSPDGGRIGVEARRDVAAIRIEVSDRGPGIAAEDLPRIFDRLHKDRASPGSGLGLTIARNLVLAHGGAIDARNVPGAGTMVWFTLPIDQNPSSATGI